MLHFNSKHEVYKFKLWHYLSIPASIYLSIFLFIYLKDIYIYPLFISFIYKLKCTSSINPSIYLSIHLSTKIYLLIYNIYRSSYLILNVSIHNISSNDGIIYLSIYLFNFLFMYLPSGLSVKCTSSNDGIIYLSIYPYLFLSLSLSLSTLYLSK